MQVEPEITIRRVPDRDHVLAEVERQIARLERVHPRITSCRVIVEAPHTRHRTGNLYHARVWVTVPGHDVVVKRDPAAHSNHDDVGLAVRDAFRAARRRLTKHVREVRGGQQAHEPQPLGRVTRVFPAHDHAFLETADGQELYFHRNALLEGAFDALEPGTEVRFVAAQGERGPQASTVHLVRPRRGPPPPHLLGPVAEDRDATPAHAEPGPRFLPRGR
jgi:cold shock CspA family protein/ribosome-associated translation inhibitor RaiA